MTSSYAVRAYDSNGEPLPAIAYPCPGERDPIIVVQIGSDENMVEAYLNFGELAELAEALRWSALVWNK